MVSIDRAELRERQYADSRNLDARASLHRRFSTNPRPFHDWVLERMPHRPAARLLDVGCGPGLPWRGHGDRVPADWSVTMVDLSEGMARAAREARPSARVLVADAAALPFRDSSYDVVLALHMLYHLPDVPAGLREIRRVLAPGGVLVAATNGAAHMAELDTLEREALGLTEPDPRNARLSFSLESGPGLLAADFDDVRLERFDDALVVDEVEPLVDYVMSMSPDYGEEERAAVSAAVRRALERGRLRIAKDAGLLVARARA